jgi:hypothetical protein
MANSILRQRARVAHMALYATVTEPTMERRAHSPPALDNWKTTGTKQEEIPATEPDTHAGSCLKEEPEEEFPICYAEEIPCLDDMATTLEPPATKKKRGRLYEDIPTCYVKEVTYEDEVMKSACAVMMHHTEITAMNEVEARAEVGKDT